MGKKWMDFKKIFTREAVLDDSLFLRFMRTSITRNSNDFSKDFIVMKFSYDAEYRLEDGEEQKMSKEELRTFYYKNGVTFQSAHTGKHGKTEPIHYKMLYRTSGKAKKGECIFVRDNLFHKAINYLTMGFYDLMEEKAKADPDTVFKLVELSAYLSLTTACAIGYIHIPLKNILVVEDQSAYTKPMAAEIVKVANVPYENDEFVLEFNDPRMETRGMCGIGYSGMAVGKGIYEKSYIKWKDMMQRCHDKEVHKKYKPEYADKCVCEEWQNYANFKLWYDEHHVFGNRIDLDKDILKPGNKEYSPETCVLIEHYINTIFERHAQDNIYENEDGKYFVGSNRKKVYETYDEVFEFACNKKKERIEKVAEKNLGRIPKCAYDAMLRYDVEALIKRDVIAA